MMKFGGTSVADAPSRLAAAMKIVSAKEQGFSPVVVVSAIGRKGSPYATDTLLDLLRQVDPNVEPDAREVDLMVGCGEIMAASILAHTLKTMGHAALSFRGGQAGIRTDGVYGNARITRIHPVSIERAVSEGKIPVICGFQGVWVPGDGGPGGELTTLGRGGSDTTASAIGAALNAAAVEIFTDVDGVKSADPNFVEKPPTLRKVTYDEVAELAHLGAKVVHPRAAEIAMNYKIPLWVKNTFSDDPGTEIVEREAYPGSRVTGVSHTGKLTHLAFDLGNCKDRDSTSIKLKLYDLLAQNGINLYMVGLNPSGTGFAVAKDQYALVEKLLDGLVLPVDGRFYLFQIGRLASHEVMTQQKLLAPVGNVETIVAELTEGCTMVSVIGHDYMGQPGVFLKLLTALSEEQIPVYQTSDSDFSISCLIPEAEMRRALRKLHDVFGLSVTA
ncbi:MAG: aspartate kinase [Armatimonadetes bacterium]|nr:aspartate kinase [Armatimonadota bacterium]